MKNPFEMFATPDDKRAVDAANKVEFIHLETGMTKEEFAEAFGSMTPREVAKLCVLGDKPVPSNPEEWKALADKAKEAANQFRKAAEKKEE